MLQQSTELDKSVMLDAVTDKPLSLQMHAGTHACVHTHTENPLELAVRALVAVPDHLLVHSLIHFLIKTRGPAAPISTRQ